MELTYNMLKMVAIYSLKEEGSNLVSEFELLVSVAFICNEERQSRLFWRRGVKFYFNLLEYYPPQCCIMKRFLNTQLQLS